MRLSYVKPELSKTKGAEAIADGVITANADNAQMHAPENRAALIYNDWGDHRVAADIISYMNGYNDPRRAAMFTQGTWNKKSDYLIGELPDPSTLVGCRQEPVCSKTSRRQASFGLSTL